MKRGKKAQNKKFVKPRVIKTVKIETRAGWCGTNGKVIVGQGGCVTSLS